MRLVKIPDISYQEFEKIIDLLCESIPYGLVSWNYRKNLKTAFFQFWDEFYIPKSLKKFISRPPGTEEKMLKLSNEIYDILHS